MYENRSQERVLKRGVIKEELVELCGCWRQALLLNQLLYWTQIIRETDRNIQVQINDFMKAGFKEQASKLDSLIRDGWFYKRGEDLASEVMAFKKTAVNDLVNKLEAQKFIYTRPISSTNKTKYFKVNVRYIHDRLSDLGYSLEGFTFNEEPKPQYLSQTGIRSGTIAPKNNENPSDIAKPESGQAEISQTGIRSPQTGIRSHTKNTYTENSFVVVVGKVQELFFKYMGIEISFTSAERVFLQHTEHGKDIEQAIQETVEWSSLSGKKITNPVGAVIHAIQNGWNLDELRQKNEEKLRETNKRRIKRSSRLKSNLESGRKGLPESIRKQLHYDDQEAEENPLNQKGVSEEQVNRIQEKLKNMQESLNNHFNSTNGMD